MNLVKALLIGILCLGILIFAVGLYLVLKPEKGVSNASAQNTVPTVQTNIKTSPVNKTISVPMTQEWTDSKIDITAGQQLVISATGKGVWKNISKNNPNATPNSYEECSPNGTSPNSNDYWSNIYQYQMRANKGALIGRIGFNGLPFKIGSNFSQKINENGRLYLGINDMKQNIDYTSYDDNSGSFQAQIEIK